MYFQVELVGKMGAARSVVRVERATKAQRVSLLIITKPELPVLGAYGARHEKRGVHSQLLCTEVLN